MSELSMHYYGDPILRVKCERVKEFGKNLRTLGEKMLDVMEKAKGIGLAAPQVGLSLQLFVLDVQYDDHVPVLDGKACSLKAIMPMIFANASVAVPDGVPVTRIEGCLSFASIANKVDRVEQATVHFQDADGAPHVLVCAGILARCIQHEHDHCQGVLFIDRMRPIQQKETRAKAKKLYQATTLALKAARKRT